MLGNHIHKIIHGIMLYSNTCLHVCGIIVVTSFLWRTNCPKLLPNFGFTLKGRIDHMGVLQTPIKLNNYAKLSTPFGVQMLQFQCFFFLKQDMTNNWNPCFAITLCDNNSRRHSEIYCPIFLSHCVSRISEEKFRPNRIKPPKADCSLNLNSPSNVTAIQLVDRRVKAWKKIRLYLD